MEIEETLVQQYGALMTVDDLAAFLRRSPTSLRNSLRSNDDFFLRVNDTRLKIGRRIYFRTSQLAQVIEG